MKIILQLQISDFKETSCVPFEDSGMYVQRDTPPRARDLVAVKHNH
jgi:hypothetical protein